MKTERKKELFLEAFDKNLGIISRSCESINVSRMAYYKWIKNDEDFAEKVKAIEEKKIDYVESKLVELIRGEKDDRGKYTMKPDTASIIFFLKTKAKHRGYVERQEQQHEIKESYGGFVAQFKSKNVE